MRTWQADTDTSSNAALGALVSNVLPALGEPRFGDSMLRELRATLPVGSLSVYRTGARPAIFLSASLDAHDTTQDCWRAYLSGPIRNDRTLRPVAPAAPSHVLRLCHITADEVPAEHRAKVYEAHGVSERISVVDEEGDGSLFAVNFYRHCDQRPLQDGQLADFGRFGSVVMAMMRKHLALVARDAPTGSPAHQRLQALQPALTTRELDVCARLLKGMTQEGIAADLGLGVPTVKTYRNRAFARLGIHFRSELFALMLALPPAGDALGDRAD